MTSPKSKKRPLKAKKKPKVTPACPIADKCEYCRRGEFHSDWHLSQAVATQTGRWKAL